MKDDEKLVCDRIPDLIRARGGDPKVRVAKCEERIPLLIRKIFEEAGELSRAEGRLRQLEKLADLQQVMRALMKEIGVTALDVSGRRQEREAEKGGFTQWHVLEITDDDPGLDEKSEELEEIDDIEEILSERPHE